MNNEQEVDKLLTKTLLSIGVPVERLLFGGKADSFITFQLITKQETAFSDDDGAAIESFYRANIFSKNDYTDLLHRTYSALKEAGFYGITVNSEIYEHDTGFYHVPMDFYYTEMED